MRKGFVWLLVSSMLALSLVLASCGPAAVEEVEAEVEEVAPEVVKPQHGGTLTTITSLVLTTPKSWDPNDQNWYTAAWAGGIYTNVMTGDLQKGPRGTGFFDFGSTGYIPLEAMKGYMVESWEFEDPAEDPLHDVFEEYGSIPEEYQSGREGERYDFVKDPQRVIFHLRKGIMFPDKPGVMDSRELTAEDVVYALNRFKFESGYPEPGPHDFYRSWDVIDNYTVAMNLNYYSTLWFIHSCYRWASSLIYPPELVEAGFDWQNVTGAGPFMLDDYVPDSTIIFKSNPVYFDKAFIDGEEYQLPFVDKWEVPFITETSTQLAAIRTGKADMTFSLEPQYRKDLESSTPQLVSFKSLRQGIYHLSLRMDQAPTDDIRVRQALAMAIDNEAIRDSLYEGDAELLNSPFTASWPETLFTPLEDYGEMTQKCFGYHPEEAKQLLAEAGYPDGFKIDVLYPNQTWARDLIGFIESYFTDIGVEPVLREYEYHAFMSLVGERDYDTVLNGRGTNPPWVGIDDYMSPGYIPWNMSIFDEPDVWERAESGKKLKDRTKELEALKWINKSYIETIPEIQFPAVYNYSYAWPWVKNWYGELGWNWGPAKVIEQIWIDQDKKAEMGY